MPHGGRDSLREKYPTRKLHCFHQPKLATPLRTLHLSNSFAWWWGLWACDVKVRAGPGTWAGRSRLLQSGGDDDWPHVSPWGNCEGGREGRGESTWRASERKGRPHARARERGGRERSLPRMEKKLEAALTPSPAMHRRG